MVRGILGNFHQGCAKFSPYNGVQCTAMALVALLAFFQVGNVGISNILPTDIDGILDDGNFLYSRIATSIQDIRYLSHSDLPDVVEYRGETYSASYTRDVYYGQINVYNEIHLGQTSFFDAISQASILSPYQLLTVNGLSVALYVCLRDSQFIIFDSHERNTQGFYSNGGSAVVLSFNSFDELVDHIFVQYSGFAYELTPVHISVPMYTAYPIHTIEDMPDSADRGFSSSVYDATTGNLDDSCKLEKDIIEQPDLGSPVAVPLNTNYSYLFVNSCDSLFSYHNNITSHGSKTEWCKTQGKHPSTCNKPFTNFSLYTPSNDLNSCLLTDNMIGSDNKHVNSCNLHSNKSHTKLQPIKTKTLSKKRCTPHANHTYSASDGQIIKKKRSRKYATKPSLCEIPMVHSGTCSDIENVHICMLEVGMVCNVSTSVNMSFIDFVLLGNHNRDYEQTIRLKPTFTCDSCNRFLFKDQVHVVRTQSDILSRLQLQIPCNVCKTCHTQISKGKLPSISYNSNFLAPGVVPDELIGLTNLEKRLISKINIFMSVVMLPGGQFAEKGLILNLPAQTDEVLSKLPLNAKNVSHVVVSFESTSSSPNQIEGYPVRLQKIHDALIWLKKHNPLYHDIEIDNLDCDGTFPDSDSSNIEDNLEENVLIPVNPTGECVVEALNSESCRVNLSPNTQAAVDILKLPSGEEMAFPWLFPYGCSGLNTDRPIKVNLNMYFRTRLYNSDSRFRKNITYLLHSAVAYDVSCLKSAVNIRMKMTRSNTINSDPVTAGSLRNVAEQADILENSYMFMKKIKGTVAYFKNMLYDLLAAFRCLGPPTLFMTLSADDLHWPELGMTLNDIEFDDAFGRSFFTSMRNDPVVTATHFERRFRALMKHVILGDTKPLGDVVDYFARVEFQNRGSPHIHMFLWIANIPHVINDTTAPEVISYIDSIVSSVKPDENDLELFSLVSRVQMHKHSAYCLQRKSCRFGFPKTVSANTRLLRNVDACARNKGRFYITKRDSSGIYVNDYNPTILRHWRANMDIQIIQNAEGAAYYVCSYLCKAEPDDLKNALGSLIHDILNQNPDIPKHARLLKIGLCVLKHRRLSAQEAAFRMGALQLMHTSRTFVYLNTWPVHKRLKILKPYQEIEHMADDDTDIFQYNIIDYYRDRPVSLEKYSLFRFASWFVKTTEPKDKTSYTNRFYCSKYNVWFRKKQKFSVVRHSKFPLGSDDYYYSMLLLLLPHRHEQSLLGNFSSPQQAFESKKDFFDDSINHLFVSLTEEIENVVRRIRMCETELAHTETVIDNVAEVIDLPSVPLHDQADDVDLRDIPGFSDDVTLHMHSLSSCSMSVDDFKRHFVQLTLCQKNAVQYVQKCVEARQAFHIFITGGAGTGKSYVVKVIIAYLELFASCQMGFSPVVVCAPTGTAARNVHGMTIHSLLKIPVTKYNVYSPLHDAALAKLQRKFKTVSTIIIDEISMAEKEVKKTVECKVLKKSKALLQYEGRSGTLQYFNVIGANDKTLYLLKIYQIHKFTTVREGFSYKIANCLEKSDAFWVVSTSSIGFSKPVTVAEGIEVPLLPEEEPPTGSKRTLKSALTSPQKSTIKAKIVKVSPVKFRREGTLPVRCLGLKDQSGFAKLALFDQMAEQTYQPNSVVEVTGVYKKTWKASTQLAVTRTSTCQFIKDTEVPVTLNEQDQAYFQKDQDFYVDPVESVSSYELDSIYEVATYSACATQTCRKKKMQENGVCEICQGSDAVPTFRAKVGIISIGDGMQKDVTLFEQDLVKLFGEMVKGSEDDLLFDMIAQLPVTFSAKLMGSNFYNIKKSDTSKQAPVPDF